MFFRYCGSLSVAQMLKKKTCYNVLISKITSSHISNVIFLLMILLKEERRKLVSLVSDCDGKRALEASLCSSRICWLHLLSQSLFHYFRLTPAGLSQWLFCGGKTVFCCPDFFNSLRFILFCGQQIPRPITCLSQNYWKCGFVRSLIK